MPIETIGSALGFLLLIAPGLVWEWCWEQHRPAVERTTFREVARISLVSFIFTGSSLLLILMFQALFPRQSINPHQLFLDPRTYSANHFRRVAIFLTVEALIAISAAYLTYKWKSRKLIKSHFAQDAIWNVMSSGDPAGKRPVVEATLKDGRVFRGVVSDIDDSIDLDQRVIALTQPIKYLASSKLADLDPKWERLIIPMQEVRELYVAFVKRPPVQAKGIWFRVKSRVPRGRK